MPRVPTQTGKKEFTDSFGNTQDLSKETMLGHLPSGPVATGPTAQNIPSGPARFVWEVGPNDVVIRTVRDYGSGRIGYIVKTQKGVKK